LNPLNLNPLRDLVERLVDFDNVNRCAGDLGSCHRHAGAHWARAHLLARSCDADSVMASACLPQFYPAVEIDGEPYWDGGFSANPALDAARHELCESADIVIVQINPIVRHEPPYLAREIINRINEISFNTALIKELRAIADAADGRGQGLRSRRGGADLHPPHPHRRRGAGSLGLEQAQRRMGVSADAVRARARLGRRWLDQHFDVIGRRRPSTSRPSSTTRLPSNPRLK
jgi:NTE family protein